MYACVYSPGYDDDQHRDRRDRAVSAPQGRPERPALRDIAQQFSPRYETHRDLVVIDVRGLDRLFGNARSIGDELRREAADRGLRVHVAIASTQTTATILAIARPGVVVVEPGDEAAAVVQIPIDILRSPGLSSLGVARDGALQMFFQWGLRTLGDLAALPADELSARLGQQGLAWHTIARGADVRPLVPDVDAERFEASLDLEWPIEGLEPLSFVLTRLLEPLSLRLEQRDRGVAVLHVQLRLVTKEMYARRLELPTPMRDVKTLRTLALLDLEAQSLFTPATTVRSTATTAIVSEQVGIDRVAIVIDPTPGRVWQHTLFARPHPTPEQLSTLIARLGAAMGQDRIGAPALVDSYRPGAFELRPFATVHNDQRKDGRERREISALNGVALRRCRQPVPARVAAEANGRPLKITTDRRGFAGGAVLHATGPWKTSGEWWLGDAVKAGKAGWDRDEWDVALSDGASYRVFLDCPSGRWFIDAILD
jgi:protein ImuB